MRINEHLPKPTGQSLRLLVGKVSEPKLVTSYRGLMPSPAIVRLVETGVGMAGLEDPIDNIEWSGIFNHVLLSTRVAVHYGRILQEKGQDIDSQAILVAGIVSHLGRRIWDEANWYRHAVAEGSVKRSKTNETIGVEILENAGVGGKVLDIVKGLAHGHDVNPTIYLLPEYRLFSLVDHLITDRVHSYAERMGAITTGWFMDKERVTKRNSSYVKRAITQAFKDAENGKHVSAERIMSKFINYGAKPMSIRLSLARFAELVVEDAETAWQLKQAGIDVTKADEIPMPRWEAYLRRTYLQDAESNTFKLTSAVHQTHSTSLRVHRKQHGIESWNNQLLKLIRGILPQEKWASKELEKLYLDKRLDPQPASGNQSIRPLVGWHRAIWFFSYLDSTETERRGYRKINKRERQLAKEFDRDKPSNVKLALGLFQLGLNYLMLNSEERSGYRKLRKLRRSS